MGLDKRHRPVTNECWNISKPLGSISCRNFKRLARAFQSAAAKVYGAPVFLEITTMGEDRSKYALLKADDLTLLKKTDWRTTRMVEVTFRPASDPQGLADEGGTMRYNFNKAGITCFMKSAGRDVRPVKKAVVAAKPFLCMAIDR